MSKKGFWLTAIAGAALLVGGVAVQGWAATATPGPAPATTATAQTSTQPSAAAGTKSTELVGKIVAFTPTSKTLVVDVPEGTKMLTVGVWLTPTTKIMEGTKPIPVASLKEGEEVRLGFRRITGGDDATVIDVLRTANS